MLENKKINLDCSSGKTQPDGLGVISKSDNTSRQNSVGKTIFLISCCKKKLPYVSRAEKLYESSGFKSQLAYAKSQKPDAIYVLSALHHLVALDAVLEPYDVCLKDFSKEEKKEWAKEVLSQLKKVSDIEKDRFVILAGKDYYGELVKDLKKCELPLKHFRQGKAKKWLKEHIDADN